MTNKPKGNQVNGKEKEKWQPRQDPQNLNLGYHHS